MNRRIAAWTIAAVAVLGLTACSAPASSTDDTKPESGSSAPARDKQTDSGQSIADACTIAGVKIQEATDAFSSIDMAAAQSDPQGTVEEFTAIVDAIGEATESVSNAEVKTAMTAFHEDYASLRDVLQKVLVDQDVNAASEMGELGTDLQESALAIGELCAG